MVFGLSCACHQVSVACKFKYTRFAPLYNAHQRKVSLLTSHPNINIRWVLARM